MEYIIYKDGKKLFQGTEGEVYTFMHREESFSLDYCCKYMGYKIEELKQEAFKHDI
tara:strand:+ start:115 stop:282 length:168 start_codon:yes stop_codon:yes gene_type:complete